MALDITQRDLDEFQTTIQDQSASVATCICEFDTPVDPQAFCDDVFDADSDYDAWGAKIQIASNPETGDEYWKVPALLHESSKSEDGMNIASVTVEVAPEYMRCYITEEVDITQVYTFLTAVDADYAITVTIPEVSPYV